MAQELANLKGTVVLVGNEASVRKVYKDLKLPARSHINERTHRAYTQYGTPELGDGRNAKGTRKKTLTFTFNRPQIRGNWENDVKELINRSIARNNVDVEYRLHDIEREEV